MEILAAAKSDLTISEIASALDVHRTIAHRLVITLLKRELVSRSSIGRYRLGPGIVRLAAAVGGELRAIARPYLIELNRDTDETVHLVTLAGTEVVFIDAFESSKALRVVSRVGRSLPAHATSVGKAILATLKDEELDALYPSSKLDAAAPRTIKNRADLFKQLAAIRECGYATSVEESEAGVGSVGVAIIDRHGAARAALSVAAPITRLTPASVPHLAVVAQRIAKEIGENL